MAGVYIKNMKMPSTCDECLSGFVKTIGCTKRLGFFERDTQRHPECPLVEVEDHGNLIDRDDFLMRDLAYCPPELQSDGQYILVKLDKAKIVLEADTDG